jgi:hypothetical protein
VAADVRAVKTRSGGTAVQVVHVTHDPGPSTTPLTASTGTEVGTAGSAQAWLLSRRRHRYAARRAGLGCDGRRGAAALRLALIGGWGVPVMSGPHDPAAAGGDRVRAGHADREQVIEALKDAFVAGRPPWSGVVSERAQHAAVDPQRLQESERVVLGEYVGGGELAEVLPGHRGGGLG